MKKYQTLRVNISPHLIIKKCTCNKLNAKIEEKELVSKYDISSCIDNSCLDKKYSTISNKSRIKSRAR